MRAVSDQINGRGAHTSGNRSRWLFATVMFAIGLVPMTQIARAAGPSNAPACSGATYTVVSGDSWSRIASRARVSMSSLVAANGATTATVIHPGQVLCLPGPTPAAPAPSPASAAPATTLPATPTAAPAPSPVAGPAVSLAAFPVQGLCSFTDTYGAPRGGGRAHEGVDIIAKAGQWVYAVKDGTLTKQYLNSPGSLSGNGWRLTAADGTFFFYAHLSAFASGLSVGSAVKAGQIIGQIGMTGNAPIPHLHFEVHPGGGASINATTVVKAVDGCKVTAVPPQPNGVVPVTLPTTPTTPATPTPAPPVPTSPAPTPTPTTTTVPAPPTSVYVPVAHRRDISDLGGLGRPRR